MPEIDITIGGRSFAVACQPGEEHFLRTAAQMLDAEAAPIVTGDSREGWTVVTDGLKPGAPYVRKGAFALKARLLRSQLGEE